MWCLQLLSFQKGYPLEYRVNTGNSNRNMRFGNTVLSQQGGCPSGGGKAPKNVFIFKNKWLFLTFSPGRILIGGLY
jgi:hypothetical protein